MAISNPVEDVQTKRNEVEAYLEEQVRAGNHFHRSDAIAGDLPHSAPEIDAVIAELQQHSDILEIDSRNGTTGTTWVVALSHPW